MISNEPRTIEISCLNINHRLADSFNNILEIDSHGFLFIFYPCNINAQHVLCMDVTKKHLRQASLYHISKYIITITITAMSVQLK